MLYFVDHILTFMRLGEASNDDSPWDAGQSAEGAEGASPPEGASSPEGAAGASGDKERERLTHAEERRT